MHIPTSSRSQTLNQFHVVWAASNQSSNYTLGENDHIMYASCRIYITVPYTHTHPHYQLLHSVVYNALRFLRRVSIGDQHCSQRQRTHQMWFYVSMLVVNFAVVPLRWNIKFCLIVVQHVYNLLDNSANHNNNKMGNCDTCR